MYKLPVGDQSFRDEIAEAKLGLAGKPPADSRRVYAAQLRRSLGRLGKSGAAAGVPVMGAEREYHAALHADHRRNTALTARSDAATRVLPHDTWGWVRLVAGCVSLGGIGYLLYLWL